MLGIVELIAGPIFKIIDKVIPDPVAKEQAKLKLLELQQQGEFKELELAMGAITAEAKSTDPWTSRARPTFLYLMYSIIILCFVGGISSAFGLATEVSVAANGAANMLAAIPEAMWWLFGAGYLGYTGGRTFEKWKGTTGK